jgi:hypothetical protein
MKGMDTADFLELTFKKIILVWREDEHWTLPLIFLNIKLT